MSSKRILLVTPTSDKEMANKAFMCPNLGILRLAAFLTKHGHPADTLDTNIIQFTEETTLEAKLKEKEWDIIGFSVLEETLLNDMTNLHLAKKLCPNAVLVAGGMEAQFNYQTILDKTPCRIVVLGEGEIPMLQLANGVAPGTIPGIIFKNDALPLTHEQFWEATQAIDWEHIEYEKYWDFYVHKYGEVYNEYHDEQIHTVRIFTKNRCPFGCHFCSSTNQLTQASSKGVRIVSLGSDEILATVDRIVKSHPRVKTIYFTDDDFAVIRQSVLNFCKAAVERGGFGVNFMCLLRIADLDEEVIYWMKRAPFRNLIIGIESFSAETLKEMSKKVKKEIIHENLTLLRKYRLKTYFNLILTTPGVTLDAVEENIDWGMYYCQDPNFTCGVHVVTMPLKGSNYYEMYSDYKTEILKVPGTHHYLKRDLMIWSKCPYVREVQEEFLREMDGELESRIQAANIKHRNSTNVALIRLRFVKEIILRLRKKYSLMPARDWVSEIRAEAAANPLDHGWLPEGYFDESHIEPLARIEAGLAQNA